MIRFELEDENRNVVLDGEVEDMQECKRELQKFYGYNTVLMHVDTINNDYEPKCDIDAYVVYSDGKVLDTLYVVNNYEIYEHDWDEDFLNEC